MSTPYLKRALLIIIQLFFIKPTRLKYLHTRALRFTVEPTYVLPFLLFLSRYTQDTPLFSFNISTLFKSRFSYTRTGTTDSLHGEFWLNVTRRLWNLQSSIGSLTSIRNRRKWSLLIFIKVWSVGTFRQINLLFSRY